MTDPRDPDAFPDEVPLADAVEQARTAGEPADPAIPGGSGPPLESNESDWQEQRLIVDDPDEDYSPQV